MLGAIYNVISAEFSSGFGAIFVYILAKHACILCFVFCQSLAIFSDVILKKEPPTFVTFAYLWYSIVCKI